MRKPRTKIDDLLHDLKCNHDALGRKETIYSRVIDEINRSQKQEKEWADCVERLACAGYRLMQIAGGADIETGDMLFSCKEGTFSEEIATQRILALIKKANKANKASDAFDVMMRRGWSVAFDSIVAKWNCVDENGRGLDCSNVKGTREYPLHDDPFTALVEADKWYRKHVEKST